MQEFIDSFVKYGYILVFLYSLGGGMFALLALGVFSSAYDINPYISIFVAFIGNLAGNCLIYFLMKINKNEYSKYVFKYKRKVALMVVLFRKNAFIFTLICKFIYGLKTISPIASALVKMRFDKFFIYNAISCFVWAVSVFYTALYAASFIKNTFEQYSSYAPIVLFAILFLIFLFFKIKARK